jgi:hypothetical protein
VASPLALLLLSVAVGVATAHHDGHLSDASVSPRQVEAGGTVAMAVTYTDAAGAVPRAVAVVVDRTIEPMAAGSGALKTGVRYEASVVPAAGWHAIAFTATDATGVEETVWAGYLQVKGGDTPGSGSDPTPAPTSSCKPKPGATRTPAPTPAVGGGHGGDGQDGSGGGDGGSGGSRSTPGSGATPAPGSGTSPTPGATPAPGSGGSPAPGATPAPGGAASPAPTGATDKHPGAATTTRPGAGGQSAGGQGGQSGPAGNAVAGPGDGHATDPAAGSAALGDVIVKAVEETRGAVATGVEQARADLLAQYGHASLPTLLRELAPTIVTATTGGAAWAAFVIFGKRRRDGDESEPDLLLATSAATGVDTGAAQGLRTVDESQLPRWRRPSLQQVRKADPLRAVAEAPTMSFATAGVRPLERYERRNIRYRLVRLLDCPDEVRASEIGILDRGDEIQLLERYGVYWRVLCPDGRTGWVHRMTLSEPMSESTFKVAEAVVPACGPAFEPTFEATEEPVEPTPAAPEENVDGLLEAYMRARSDVARPVEGVEPAGLEAVGAVEASVEAIANEPAPAVGPSVAALAHDYLQRAGFAVHGPESAAQPAVETGASTASVDRPSSDATPAARPERADGRYSGHKSGGSRKASTASRPGARSRPPSR